MREIIVYSFLLLLPLLWWGIYAFTKKSKNLWLGIGLGTLGHMAYLLGYIFIISILDDFSMVEVFASLDEPFAILLTSIMLFAGLVFSTLIVLFVSGKRVVVLASLVVISVLAFTPILDGVEFDPLLFLDDKLQKKELEFHGNILKFPPPYIYYHLKGDPEAGTLSTLQVERIRPGYKGVEDSFYIQVRGGTQEMRAMFEPDCGKGEGGCVVEEMPNYKVLSFPTQYLHTEENQTVFYYYSQNCSSYLYHTTWDDSDRRIYTEFVEYFFSEGCKAA